MPSQNAQQIPDEREVGTRPSFHHVSPTLYAFGFLSEPERDLVASRLRDRYGLHPAAITWTKAANQGAVLACATREKLDNLV